LTKQHDEEKGTRIENHKKKREKRKEKKTNLSVTTPA
jgi:hypothetical protein